MAVDLGALSPDTKNVALALQDLAAQNGLKLTFASGRRTCADQTSKYAQGRTTPGDIITDAQGCQSWHVVGRAFDVDITPHGAADWQTLGELGRSLGLIWGGDFKTSAHLHDVGHFEYHPGLTLADVCPNPAACVDGQSVPLPATGASSPSSPWLESSQCGGPRTRLYEDGRVEIEGLGFPSWKTPSWMENYRSIIYAASKESGIPPHLIVAWAGEEGSRGNPKACSGSPSGACDGPCEICKCIAYGIMQLTLDTAKGLNSGKALTPCELFNPELNIHLGAKLLRQLFDKYRGNIVKMAFSYNAGGLFCGPGHWKCPCDPATEACETDKNGNPFRKMACDPPNVWNLAGDCKGKKCISTTGTVDYAGGVIRFMNGALPAWRADVVDPKPPFVLPDFVPPVINRPVTVAANVVARNPFTTILIGGSVIGLAAAAALALTAPAAASAASASLRKPITRKASHARRLRP